MNKLFTKIAGVFLGLAMAVGVGAVASSKTTNLTAAEESTPYKVALFGSNYNSEKVGGYTNSWSSTNAGFTVNLQNWNNNNNGWEYIRTGQKKYDVTGTIATDASIDKPIDKVVLTIDSIIDTNVTYLRLFTSLDAKAWTSVGDFEKKQGDVTVTLSSPSANLYYKIEAACTKKSNGFLQVSKVSYYSNVVVTLNGLTISGERKTNFLQGSAFDHSGMVVIANYTGKDDVDVTSEAVWSSPDMSVAGEQIVTVSYTDTELNVTKTVTYAITIEALKTVASFTFLNGISSGGVIKTEAKANETSVVGSFVYYLLKFTDGTYGAPNLAWNTEEGISKVDHFTNSDIGTDEGGYVEPTFTKNGIYTLTLTYGSESSLTISWKVKGFPTFTETSDVLNPANIGNPSSYADWSGKTNTIDGINSEASYSGNSTGAEKYLQLNSSYNSGIFNTISGGKIAKVSIVWNTQTAETRSVEIYAKNSPFNSISDVKSQASTKVGAISRTQTEYVFADNYAFFGILPKGGAIYLDSVTITWLVESAPVDMLKSIAISGNLSKTSYYVDQAISQDGYEVTATFEDDDANEYQSVVTAKAEWTISYPKALAIDVGTTKNVSFTASYTAGDITKTVSTASDISILADSVVSLGWSNRGTINIFAGTILENAVDTTKWSFTSTWASGKTESPKFGIGEDDVHVALYDSPTPDSESENILTPSYELKYSDNGKYLVAYYKGTRSSNNTTITVIKWREVIENISSTGTYDFSTVATESNSLNGAEINEYYDSSKELVSPTVTTSAVYTYKGTIRLAASGGPGSIEFDFGSVKITDITIVARGWSASEKACKMSITNGGTVTTTSETDFDTFQVKLSSPISKVKFSSAAKNRICIQSIMFAGGGEQQIGKTTDCLGLEAFIDSYLHMSDYLTGLGWCADTEHGYYSTAKTAYNALNEHQKSLFVSNNAYSAEFARLSAWARANGETFDASNNLSTASLVGQLIGGNGSKTTGIVALISLVSFTAIGSFFFIRKRKEQN